MASIKDYQQTLQVKAKELDINMISLVDGLDPYQITKNKWTTEIEENPCVTYPDIFTLKSLLC